MKILKKSSKKPGWPKKGKCQFCGIVVEAEKKDVQDFSERGDAHTVWGCQCPNKDCYGHIYFR